MCWEALLNPFWKDLNIKITHGCVVIAVMVGTIGTKSGDLGSHVGLVTN